MLLRARRKLAALLTGGRGKGGEQDEPAAGADPLREADR
jgi:hypothetical protein